VRKTSVELPDDLDELMRRGAASVGQSPAQFVREAVLLRCAIAAGDVTDEMAAIAKRLAEAAERRPPR
jgi:predicted DNA-binding protein